MQLRNYLTVVNSALPPSPEHTQNVPPASPIPLEHVGTLERGNSLSPTHDHSPSQSGNPVPASSGTATSSAADTTHLPPRPWPPAPLAPGVDAKAPKLVNRAYSIVVAGMLTEAQHRFECLVFVEDAYPDLNTQIWWAFECWEAVCSKSKTYFELSKEMMSLVCRHISSLVTTEYHYSYL